MANRNQDGESYCAEKSGGENQIFCLEFALLGGGFPKNFFLLGGGFKDVFG